MHKKNQSKEKGATQANSVADSIEQINRLKKSKSVHSHDIFPTGDSQGVKPIIKEYDEKYSSKLIDEKLETGLGLPQTGLAEEKEKIINKTIELGDKQVTLDLTREIENVKKKQWKMAIGFLAAMLTILTPLLIYFHNDLKSAIKDVENRISNKVNELIIQIPYYVQQELSQNKNDKKR